MIERLIECGSCSRHVKACDATCPFCGASLRAAARVKTPYGRMTAAAAVAAGVASIAGCGNGSTPTLNAYYGSPGITGTVDASSPSGDAGDAAAADGANGE